MIQNDLLKMIVPAETDAGCAGVGVCVTGVGEGVGCAGVDDGTKAGITSYEHYGSIIVHAYQLTLAVFSTVLIEV